MCLPLQVFPTSQGQWVALADGLLLNDEPGLAELFKRQLGVHMLKIPGMG